MAAISGLSDAVSDVLGLVRMRGESIYANEYSAPWSFSFRKPLAHFHIVERGTAWIRIDGAAAVRLDSGDLVILPLGTSHVLSSRVDLKPVPIEKAMATAPRDGTVYRLGAGDDATHIVCGQFSFDGVLAKKLLKVLPPLVHISARSGRPLEWLMLTSHFLVEETRNPKPGSAIVVARLLDLLFVQAIREWGAVNPNHLGWMSGLGDDKIGRALSAIHDDPAREWTVEALAAAAGMSRSGFAARFTEIVGRPPLKYLSSWRLNLAADHLRGGSTPAGRIAELVGYGSEAALNRAFKAQFGVTPAVYRRRGATR
jgi:AraC-like DNA-binding protein